jgi:hypothetical protein
MRKSNHHELRALLRANPDGLTVKQICDITKKQDSVTRRALDGMADVYRDRWLDRGPHRGGRSIAVFVAVQVPEDCPRPDVKSKRRSRGIAAVVRPEGSERTQS